MLSLSKCSVRLYIKIGKIEYQIDNLFSSFFSCYFQAIYKRKCGSRWYVISALCDEMCVYSIVILLLKLRMWMFAKDKRDLNISFFSFFLFRQLGAVFMWIKRCACRLHTIKLLRFCVICA